MKKPYQKPQIKQKKINFKLLFTFFEEGDLLAQLCGDCSVRSDPNGYCRTCSGNPAAYCCGSSCCL